MDKINVILSDRQILFREGMHFALAGEDDFEVIGEAVDGKETLALIEANPPHVVILNTGRENYAGIELAFRIKRDYPSVAVILTGDAYDDEKLFAALKNGVDAFMSRDASPGELIDLVHQVSNGSHPIAAMLARPGVALCAINEFGTLQAADELARFEAHLTSGEVELLQAATETDQNRHANSSQPNGAAQRTLENIRCKLVYNYQHYEILKYAQAQLAVLAKPVAVEARDRLKIKKN